MRIMGVEVVQIKKMLSIGIVCILVLGGFLAIEKPTFASQNDSGALKGTRRLNPIWWETWGGSGDEVANSIAVDSSNIYVAGETLSWGADYTDAIVLKYDLNGNEIWSKTWGGSKDEVANSIAVTSSNIYVAGWTDSHGAGEWDAFVLKYDLNGNVIWSKTWGGNGSEAARSIAATASNIYVAGFTRSYGASYNDAFVLKYDLNGNEIWSKTWGGSHDELANSIAVTSSNIYVAGETRSYGTGIYDAFVLKYDLDGNEIWSKTWGGSNWDEACSIAVTSSNIYVAGGTWSYGAGIEDAFVLKYDLNGNEIWNKTWGGSGWDDACSIAVDSSNIYIAGYTQSYGAGFKDAFVLKYDLNGNEIWNRTWGDKNDDYANSIAVTSSNIYVTGMTCIPYGRGFDDVLILRCNLEGEKPKEKKKGKGFIPGFELTTLMLAIVICAILANRKRLKK